MLFHKKNKFPEKLKIKESVEYGFGQNIGAREQQQDAFSSSDFEDEILVEEIGHLVVLADGMGGLAGGAEASSQGVKSIIDIYSNKAIKESVSEALVRGITKTNEIIFDMSKKGNMGTTVVCSVINKGDLYYACVGDSRIYLVNPYRMMQLNEDHNYGMLLDEKADRGVISWDEADNDEQRTHLISYLGIKNLEYISGNKEPVKLYKDDMILMCSDGLTNGLNDYQIHQLIKLNIDKTSQEIVDILIKETLNLKMEYQDNITVLLLKYKGEIE